MSNSRCSTPSANCPAHLVAGLAEDPHHLVVLHQHLGLEPAQPVLPGRGGEVLEQDRAEPAALVVVAGDERDLGRARPVRRRRARIQALVPADGDDLVAEQADERHPGVVVDGGEPLEVARRDARVRAEVAQVAGALGQALRGTARSASASLGRIGRRCTMPPSEATHVGLPVPRVARVGCRVAGFRWTRCRWLGRHARQSRGSSGSRPCSGKTARRVSSTAVSTRSAPSVHGLVAGVARRRSSTVGSCWPVSPAVCATQPAGSGRSGSTSRSSTVAIRCVHDRGTTRNSP